MVLAGYIGSIGSISLSQSDVNVTGLSGHPNLGTEQVGGFAGSSSGLISKSYSSGSVEGYEYVGGFVGISDPNSSIEDSYSLSDVNGVYSVVGGFIGYNGGSIENSYSAGLVEGEYNVGGFIGMDASPPGSITSSYWDTQTSNQPLSDGGTGKTTAQMKQQSTFSGWDFVDTWAIEENITYPYLAD